MIILAAIVTVMVSVYASARGADPWWVTAIVAGVWGTGMALARAAEYTRDHWADIRAVPGSAWAWVSARWWVLVAPRPTARHDSRAREYDRTPRTTGLPPLPRRLR